MLMSDTPLYLIYDPAFDDMDAEGCPGFGFILVFDEQDLDNYQSGENPPFPAVSMLFTDHADGNGSDAAQTSESPRVVEQRNTEDPRANCPDEFEQPAANISSHAIVVIPRRICQGH